MSRVSLTATNPAEVCSGAHDLVMLVFRGSLSGLLFPGSLITAKKRGWKLFQCAICRTHANVSTGIYSKLISAAEALGTLDLYQAKLFDEHFAFFLTTEDLSLMTLLTRIKVRESQCIKQRLELGSSSVASAVAESNLRFDHSLPRPMRLC